MPHYLDLTSWSRRDTFQFFLGYDKPYFNICTKLDVTNLVAQLQQRPNISVSLAYHYFALRIANEIEPFRYRLRAGKVFVHDVIHGGTTVLMPNDSFIMAYFNYEDNFGSFIEAATIEIEKARAAGTFSPTPNDNLIHFTVFPWVSFTSFSHARNWGREDSEPKIAFGKFFQENERTWLPFSVEVHHALMDGLHVAQYVQRLEKALLSPEQYLSDEG